MAGFRHFDLLCRAYEALHDPSPPAADRLAEPVGWFWTASAGLGPWPPGFRGRTEELRELVRQAAPVRSSSDAALLAEIEDKLRQFVEDAEVAYHGGG